MIPPRWYHRLTNPIWSAVFAVAGKLHERRDPRYRVGGPR